MKEKVILAYSGGLDTSIILHWLRQKGYEVICYIADVGQDEDFGRIKQKALNIGAHQVVIKDLKEKFVKDYIFTSLKANAIYEHKYLLGTAIARPLIAKEQVLLAKELGATHLAHGATGKGNDQIRFELAYLQLYPEAKIISPWKDKSFLTQFKGRADMIAYASAHGIADDAVPSKPYSIDENLMHTSYEGGTLENLACHPKKEMFKMTSDLSDAPNEMEEISITFTNGVPTKLTTMTQALTEPLLLFTTLNKIAGKHGIGRIDLVENRQIGLKSRGIYETPAGTVIYQAHLDLESITLDVEVMHTLELQSKKIAQLIYNGLWFSPEMELYMGMVEQAQKSVNGTIKLGLYKGNILILGRTAKDMIYKETLASMDESASFDQQDAKGFIKIKALRLMTK